MTGPSRGSAAVDRIAGSRWFPASLGVLVLLGCWTAAALLGGSERHVVPLPTDMVRTLVDDGFYLPSVAVTGWEAARGFVAGNLIALAMAALCLLVPATRRSLSGIAAASYCAAAVAVGPVLAVLLDQDQAKVIIATLALSAPAALLGAEHLITSTGLGGMIAVATSNSDFDALWAAVVVVTAASAVLFSGLTWLQNIALRQLGG